MVSTKKGFVLGATFLSGLATILLCVSCATQQWVVADGRFRSNNDKVSTIKYGLFWGVYERHLGGRILYQLSITCLMKKNVCAYLCGSKSSIRRSELQRLYNNERVQFQLDCPQVLRDNPKWYDFDGDNIRNEGRREFLNAGLYVSTVTFLSISILFGIISFLLLVFNVVKNPSQVFLGIYGVYVYNSIACFGSILTMATWGALFGSVAIRNVGILETIDNVLSTEGMADLGFSYWLLVPGTLLYAGSIGLLMMREHLINIEPKTRTYYTSQEMEAREAMYRI